MTRVSLSLLLLLHIAEGTWCAPPTVTSITPHGAERGKSVEIIISGANLWANPRLIAPFALQQKVLPDAKPNPAQARLAITVDAATPVGIYPVRVLTDEGISGLFFFGVDAFANVAEVEDNNTFAKAQKVPFPAVISGQCAGGDVDHYQFTVKKGQHIVVETEAARLGSGVLPQIRVLDARQRLLASDDSQKLRGDCRVHFIAPADGDYVVEFSDTRYRGGNPPHYRLRIGDYDVIEAVFPLGGRRGAKAEYLVFPAVVPPADAGARECRSVTPKRGLPPRAWPVEGRRLLELPPSLKPGTPSPVIAIGKYREVVRFSPCGEKGRSMILEPPMTANGCFFAPQEVHFYEMAVQPGQRWRFRVEAEALGSHLDAVLRITDGGNKELAKVDDVDLPPPAPGQPPSKTADPFLEFTVPDGVKLLGIELRDSLGRGGLNYGYRLTVEPAVADFTLQQAVTELNVPRGGAAALSVSATRRGYAGPIQLSALGLPQGLETQGGYIPASASAGMLVFRSRPDIDVPLPIYARVEGRGLEKSSPRSRAELRLVLSKDANVAASSVHIGLLAVALAAPDPLVWQAPSTIELVHGYPVSVPVAVTWGTKWKPAAVEVAAPGPPAPGKPATGAVAFKPATFPVAAEQKGALTVTAPTSAAEGRAVDLVLQAKTKVDDKDVLIVGPVIGVTVKRPFTVELLRPKVTAKSGETILLKGRVKREAVFREPIQLKLDGLPQGVTLAAPLKPLPPEQNEFQIELRSDPKTGVAAANLSLTCSATINAMTYRHPALTIALQSK